MVDVKRVKPTWATWDDFDAEYIAWRRDYEATPASAGQFFKGGEILPDGSTILESPNFERISVDINNDTSTITIVEPQIPRTRMDMKKLMEFDPQTDKRSDIKGDHARKHVFYTEYITDIERAKARDKDETDAWVNTFKKVSDQLK